MSAQTRDGRRRDARYALGAGDRERVRCRAVAGAPARSYTFAEFTGCELDRVRVDVATELRGRWHVAIAAMPAGGSAHTSHQAAQCTRSTSRAGRNRKSRIPRSTVHARAPIGDQCEWQYKSTRERKVSKTFKIGRRRAAFD